MRGSDHRGEQYEYLLGELDGARTTFFGLEALIIAFAGLALVGLQLESTLTFAVATAAAITLSWPAWMYSKYEGEIKGRLKMYLKHPDGFDLQAALRAVWAKEPVIRVFGDPEEPK